MATASSCWLSSVFEPKSAPDILESVIRNVNSDVTIVDALVDYAEQNGLEVEALGEMIRRSPKVKSTVREHVAGLNLVVGDS